MTKISVAIATRNEQAHIKDCLESVKWADEIVVFDEKSTDKTVAIAKKYTSKIYSTLHDSMFHKTKQKAIDKCTDDWILQLDADERVPEELRKEIIGTIDRNGHYVGYQVPRKSLIFGKWMEHTGWYPDYQVKLFRRGKGHYPCQSVHEMIELDGEMGTLEADLLHDHYSTMDWFLNRRIEYTKNDAANMIARGEKILWSDAIRFPSDEFFKRFFLWEGYKDGLHGLALSLLMAFDRLIVWARIWESQKFWQYNPSDFREEVVRESDQVRKNWHHWLVTSTHRPVQKIALKIKNKLSW